MVNTKVSGHPLKPGYFIYREKETERLKDEER